MLPLSHHTSRCSCRRLAAGNGYQQLLAAARQGMEQIEAKGYARGLAARYPGCDVIWAYGLGCQGKSCVAVCRRMEAGQAAGRDGDAGAGRLSGAPWRSQLP